MGERYKNAKSAEEKKKAAEEEVFANEEHGTVGVVALDQEGGGNLAAGTSTGGTVMKMPGRVPGDSPIIGRGEPTR